MTFIYFAFVVYALCFLAADARIFGADVTAWNELTDDGAVELDPENVVWLHDIGIVPLRPWLLHWRFLREHLSCYFCMGVWAGPVAHCFLWHFYQLRTQQFNNSPADYYFYHPDTTLGWTLGLVGAFLLGSVCSFLLNTLVTTLEDQS